MKYTIKKIIKKGVLWSFYFFILASVIFVIALNWSLPQLETPQKQDTLLIESITVVDVQTGMLLENRDILITDNRITSIAPSGSIPMTGKAFKINGLGKYVIPGLWDMHTHSNKHSEWLHHPLYIANGVTGVRDMSGTLHEEDSYWVGSEERLLWNKELANHTRVTPRYVLQSSYQIDGEKSVPGGAPDFFTLNSTKDVIPLLEYYKEKKVDFIKVYQQIKPESYRELARQAPRYDMHLAGHKPMFLTLEEAVTMGQRSFEHGRIFMFDCFPHADSLRISPNWRKNYSYYKKEMVAQFDETKAKKLMQLMAEKNAYWVPTLQTLKFESNAHKESFLGTKNVKYISWVRKNVWWSFDIASNKKRNLADSSKTSQKFYDKVRSQIAMAHSYNVPIMVGTDVTDSYIFPGFSVHNELEDLTKSGLSNLEALRSATIIPAQYVKKEKDFGSIEIGKIADIVILDKNPLEDIRHSKTIHGVLMNGLYYNSATLQKHKEFTQSMSASFHMNVKQFYSLIDSPLIRVQFAD